MSLQPGPDDPTDDSALTPSVPQDPGGAVPTPPPPTWQMPPTGPAPAPGAAPASGGYGVPPTPPPAPGAPAQGPYGTAAPASYGSYTGQPGAPGPGPYGAPGQGYGAAQPPGTGFPPPTGAPVYPPGYPPPGYQTLGYAPPPQTDSKAVIGLVLAITSWVLCPFILAVVALVVAGQSNQAIAVSGGRLEGRSMNTATKWISWINIVLFGLAGLAFLAFFSWAIAQDPSTWDSYVDPSTQF